nr:aminotransferase class III-fold pyridoxal phosphate-dependent enzyme [Marinicella sp. W31]MDC2879046.1 aminotransferase class III-fold pyridoxal phosphate-dependent enzyme [Marinicella sp. W31]
MSEADFVAYCVAELEHRIEREGADTIAAFIGEPVLGTGGLVPPPEGYWEAISAVLEKHDILLIADEVVTGFGRLGTMFGSAHFGLKPDLITIAKGLTRPMRRFPAQLFRRKCGRFWNRAPMKTARSATAGPIPHIRSGPRPGLPI